MRSIPTRRGAANPRVLAGLIIAGGFLGAILLYLLEPYLLSGAEEQVTERRPTIENALSAAELKETVDQIKSEMAGLLAACAPTADAFSAGIGPLVEELAPAGDGFTCYRIEPAKYALQERAPRLTQLRDWLKANARRAEDPDMRGNLVRLAADFDTLIKSADRVILGYQAYQSAAYPKSAESALRKFEPIWRAHATFVDRMQQFVTAKF